MEETTIKIELGKTDFASAKVLKHLTLNSPMDGACTTSYYRGVQVLFDVLESTFENDVRRKNIR